MSTEITTVGKYSMYQADDSRSFYFEHNELGDELSVKYTVDDQNAIVDCEETVPFTRKAERLFIDAMKAVNPTLNVEYLTDNWEQHEWKE